MGSICTMRRGRCLFCLAALMLIFGRCSSPYEGMPLARQDQWSLHCFLDESNTIAAIRVAKLKSIMDSAYQWVDEELEVKLTTADTTYIAKRLHDPGEHIVTFFIDRIRKSSNKEYHLELISGGERILKSSTRVPEMPAPDLIFKRLLDKNLKSEAIQMATAQLSLNPVSSGKQYYHLTAKKIKWINDGGSPKYIGTEEMLHVALLGQEADEVIGLVHEPGILFAVDHPLKEITLQVRTPGVIDNREEVFREVAVELRRVNREYFLYHKSLNAQIQNSRLGLPALEPIIVYSNIERGYGVFCAYYSSALSFTLD